MLYIIVQVSGVMNSHLVVEKISTQERRIVVVESKVEHQLFKIFWTNTWNPTPVPSFLVGPVEVSIFAINVLNCP